MSENNIKIKLDKIIEGLLDNILKVIEQKEHTFNEWRLVHNHIKNLSVILRIRERLDKIRTDKKQDIIPLLILNSLMQKKPESDNLRKSFEKLLEEIGSPAPLDGKIWEQISEIFKGFKTDTFDLQKTILIKQFLNDFKDIKIASGLYNIKLVDEFYDAEERWKKEMKNGK